MLSREELLNKIHTISHEIINKPRSKCKLLGISQKKGEEDGTLRDIGMEMMSPLMAELKKK